MIYWEVTSKCNYHCDYCINSEYRKLTDDLTYSQLMVISDKLKIMNIDKICITGGDPLLRDDTVSFVKMLHSKGFITINLVTNANALTNKLASDLSVYLNKISVTLHLEWTTSSPYYNVNLFNKLVDTLQVIKSTKLSVEVNILVMNRNIKYITNIIKEVYTKTGVKCFQLQPIIKAHAKVNMLSEIPDDLCLNKLFIDINNLTNSNPGLIVDFNDFNSTVTEYLVLRSNGVMVKHIGNEVFEIGNVLNDNFVEKEHHKVSYTFIDKKTISSPVNTFQQQKIEIVNGLLSDKDLKSAVQSRNIIISRDDGSFSSNEIRGCSVDLRLSNNYYRWKRKNIFKSRIIDLAIVKNTEIEDKLKHCIAEDGEGILIRPNEFILAETLEKIYISPAYAGILTGRSTYSRIGISISFTQSLIVPGHTNTIPLQIKNNTPYNLVVNPGADICQLMFYKLTSDSTIPYDKDPIAKYRGNNDRILSKIYSDDNNKLVKRPLKRKFDWKMLLDTTLIINLSILFAYNIASNFIGQQTNDALKFTLLLPLVATFIVMLIARIALYFEDNRG